MRLYLPEVWLGDKERLDKAGRARGRAAAADQGADRPGAARPGPRRGAGRQGGRWPTPATASPGRSATAWQSGGCTTSSGVTDEMVVFTEEPTVGVAPAGRPTGGAGRRTRRPPGRGLAPAGQPEGAGRADAAAEVTWREGTKGPMTGQVRLAAGLAGRRAGRPATAPGRRPIWLLIEEQSDGTIKYAFSNLPAGTSRIKAVRLWRSRWPVEQGYQQMKEELGLDHHEGRSWRGFHHHACLVMLAYGFLALEQLASPTGATGRPGKKGDREPVITLPAIRRALQRLLRPTAKPDCTYCNPHAHVFDRAPHQLTE